MSLIKVRCRRQGFTLIELVLLTFILVIVTGLLGWGLLGCGGNNSEKGTNNSEKGTNNSGNSVRAAAMRSESLNNLKQMSLGVANLAGTYRGKLPPSVGYFPGNAAPSNHGTILYFILPYIEQETVYNSVASTTSIAGAKNVIPTFIAPMDPSMPSTGITPNSSLPGTSYAANYFAFGGSKDTGPVNGYPRSFRPDGTSNTVMFVEWYASCGKSDRNWAQDGVTVGPGQSTTGTSSAPAWWGGLSGTNGVVTWTNNNGVPTGNLLPLPQFGPQITACKGDDVQGFEAAGIHVSMGDGSARLVTSKISQTTWTAVFTPNANDLPGSDWDE